MRTIKELFGVKDTPITNFINPERQSTEQVEDYAIKKVVLSKEIVTDDHNSDGTRPEVVNVCYGTSGTAPTASSVPIGTIYIQYTA